MRSSPPLSACSRVPPEALALALAAAFLHAGWNVLLRGSDDVAARTVVVLCLSVVLFAPVAAFTWRVHVAALPYIAASAVLEAVYFVLLTAAYRRRELSVVYPIARGSAPVFVLLGTAVVLSRAGHGAQVAGVLLVACGVLLVRGLRRGVEGIGIGLAIGVLIASYTLVDKEGLHHAAPIAYLELVLLPIALVALPAYVWRWGFHPFTAQLNWSTLGAAIGSFGAYVLFLFALRLTAAPGVAAVRETSVVIAALLAAVFLRERVTLWRLAGAVAVAGGVAILAAA
jgi:drug/metabolite transporter (DMT)-like permease